MTQRLSPSAFLQGWNSESHLTGEEFDSMAFLSESEVAKFLDADSQRIFVLEDSEQGQ